MIKQKGKVSVNHYRRLHPVPSSQPRDGNSFTVLLYNGIFVHSSFQYSVDSAGINPFSCPSFYSFNESVCIEMVPENR